MLSFFLRYANGTRISKPIEANPKVVIRGFEIAKLRKAWTLDET